MERKEKAINYFRDGYNCAQAIVLGCAGEDKTLTKAAAAFGGGMGRMQKTCGAVTGAYIYIGLTYGVEGIPADSDKVNVYSRVCRFKEEFVRKNGTDQCSELLGEDLNTPEGKARIKERGLHEKVCEKCLRDAIDILNDLE